MKKIIIMLVTTLLVGCSLNPKPIERYKGKGYVVTRISNDFASNRVLQLKNESVIIEATVLFFDAQNLKVGDSLK